MHTQIKLIKHPDKKNDIITTFNKINDNLIQNRTFQLMNKGKSVAEKRTQSLDYMIGASIIFFYAFTRVPPFIKTK